MGVTIQIQISQTSKLEFGPAASQPTDEQLGTPKQASPSLTPMKIMLGGGLVGSQSTTIPMAPEFQSLSQDRTTPSTDKHMKAQRGLVVYPKSHRE